MIKLRKIIGYTVFTLFLFACIVTLFISPLVKYTIEKYDVKYTGRQIEMDWAYVNPFTGFIHLNDVRIFENQSDTLFITAHAIKANLALWKLFSKTFEFSELTLIQPKGYIIQNKDSFNFKDLLLRFLPKKDSLIEKEPVHLNILNIEIQEGEFYYSEKITPIYYFIKDVNIKSSGLRWNVDSIPCTFSFNSGIGGGEMKGQLTLNSKTKDYSLAVIAHKFNLNIVGQYLKDLSNYGSFKAYLEADFKSKGNLLDRENVSSSGYLEINDFHFGKNPKEDYVSFDRLSIAIKELSPKKLIYSYDSISLKQPYFKYEKYDHLDNVQTVFGKKGANIEAVANSQKFNLVVEIARYLKVISKNFFRSNYSINRFAVYNANMKYNDYSLNEKFSIQLNPLTFTTDSIQKIYKRVNFELKSEIQPYGRINLDISMNPKDSSDFDLNYQLNGIPISIFNPYLIKYSSFPVDRGSLEIKGFWHVRNGMIQSTNSLALIDPRVADKLRNKNNNWLPLRFFMFFVRERGNVIDYQIPITGNLRDPKFHLKDVILDALSNVFVKPVTTAYRMEVKEMETTIEESLSLSWRTRDSELSSEQEDFLRHLSNFLKEEPKATISIYPHIYSLKEKEYILLFEAKKMYLMKVLKKDQASFTEEDSVSTIALSIKDSLFLKFLNKMSPDPMLFTVQDKCGALISKTFLEKQYTRLNSERERVVRELFSEAKVLTQVKMMKESSLIPYNGFSFFKIEFKGNLPDYVINAYKKMKELNNEKPRSKFKKERKKNKSSF